MCRALLYLGEPVLVDDLLFKPDNSLVKQGYMPKMLDMLNLAGFGMMAWDRSSHSPEQPFSYVSESLPIFDQNLKNLAEKVEAGCLLAHVRGVAFSSDAVISKKNTHPFCFPGCKLALAHNGDLSRAEEMKPALARHIHPSIRRHISGTTDTEWIYAMLLSQLSDPHGHTDGEEIMGAVERVLQIIRDVRNELGVDTSSSANLFITDGRQLVAVRYCFDFGRYPVDSPRSVHGYHLDYLSLWYTTGRAYGCYEGEWKMLGGSDNADTVMVASEPLTRDTTTWLEVPEYSMLYARPAGGETQLRVRHLDV